MKFEPIAIIGSGCVLPGCNSPDDLWQAAYAGAVNITSVPDHYWRVDLNKVLTEKKAEAITDRTYSTYGGYVKDFNRLFDPSVYAVSKELLLQLDPLVQWSCYAAKQGLAQAGYSDVTQRKKRAGIILGNLSYPSMNLSRLFENTYLRELFPEQIPNNDPHWLNRFASGYPALITAKALNLEGIAFCLDAACASSLYAIKLACDQLQANQHDVMLAGGVCASDSLFIHVGFSVLNAMDPQGRSRPFHKEAGGLVPAEGAGIVVLKRLADAVRDKNNILAVIRGVGLTNDGRSKNLLTPASSGQINSINAAFAMSEIKPAAVSYIECHATGTPIGDGTEIDSMSHVFNGTTPLALGSLKANLGHLITASGVAGVIKLIHAMRQECIPTTPNAHPLQGKLQDSSFYVPIKNAHWQAQEKLACINSFGFGGNNACLLMQDGYSATQPNYFHAAKKIFKKNEVVIVALDIRTNHAQDKGEFLNQLIMGSQAEITKDYLHASQLNIKKTAFPPKEMEKALGQQIILLDLFEKMLASVALTTPEQTGVYIGMGVDPNVSRYGLRYRLGDILKQYGITAGVSWLNQANDPIIGPMEAGHVLGAMPNMPANRLNFQYDCAGPGFTVSAEELSGDIAFQLAVNAIERGEINAALVGAVELVDDKAHAMAIRQLLTAAKIATGEAAVVLVLKTKDAAIRDGNEILALVEDTAQENTFTIKNNLSASPLYQSGIAYPHAASGLLHVAAATLLLAQRAQFAKHSTQLIPVLLDKQRFDYAVKNTSVFDAHSTIHLASDESQKSLNFSLCQFPQIFTYSAGDREELLVKLKQDSADSSATPSGVRLAIVGYANEIAELKRQAIYQVENNSLKDGLSYKGIYYREQPVKGELAFVYTGAAACYPEMARELLLTLPKLVHCLNEKFGDLHSYIDWIYSAGDLHAGLPFYQLTGSSFLCQIHTLVSRQLFGLNPDAAIGLSSGETNYMFALDIWRGLKDLLEKIAASELYTKYLGSEFSSIKQYWGTPASQSINWANWHIHAPVAEIKQLLKKEEKVFLTIIYTDNDCIIGGDSAACQRIVDRIGKQNAISLQHDLAIHCAAVTPFEQTWRQLHTRTVTSINVRCYSNYFGDSYELTQQSVAQALTGQALQTIDFPKIIRKAWQDGVRIFIEHGPKNNLTRAIHTILADKPHLAIAMDNANNSFKQLFDVAAQLWCAGVAINLESLRSPEQQPITQDARHLMNFPLHLPKVAFPPLTTDAYNMQTITTETVASHEIMPSIPIRAQRPQLNMLANFHTQYTALYKHALACQEELFLKQASVQQQLRNILVKRYHSPLRQHQLVLGSKQKQMDTIASVPKVAAKNYPGPAFTRQELEALAGDKISAIFGPLFKQQDDYVVQCRMPEPPLLLCDRVLGIAGEPGSMGLGKIWTETDIKKDSWFIHCGRIAPGMMIEAGQADLLLISWLGIDFLNQGKRAYRLLGCELTYRKPLPMVGETLHYEIKITGHANHGEVRLFFFQYDCYVKDEIVMSVRSGQAGFFTRNELENSAGVIWDPAKADYIEQPKMQLPQNWPVKDAYTKAEMRAYTKGDMITCFGERFLLTQTHTRTPISLLGDIYLIEEVNCLDLRGGPKGRGYMRATTQAFPDDWYFNGHFKNDPCMPGTLMAEAGMQAMAFYLTALGFALNKDGWRFEPLTENKFKFICRGQAIPSSKLITYEIFVEDIIADKYPTIIAYVLGSVDGQKAFLGEHLALRLVPDWPISSRLDLLENCRQIQANYSGPIAALDGFQFNYESLIHSAWGKPSDAFGAVCGFHDDGLNRCPRLPGPPYHFMSRILAIEAEFGKPLTGAKLISEYDIPAAAWYFTENAFPTMPYAVIMEIALQPCGWLSTFTQYNELKKMGEALFRNLDGEAELYREVTQIDKTIRVEVTLLSSFQVSSTIIVNYQVVCTIEGKIVYQLKTRFGFFSPAAFAEQKGFALDELDGYKRQLVDNNAIDVTNYAGLPGSGLMMFDVVTGYWPEQGKYEKGLIRAKKAVEASDWYFKAHFFQDPVQPGSLGIEAMLQLLQFYMLHNNYHQQFSNAHFEPVAVDKIIEWHYRGQVIPYDKEIVIELDIKLEENQHNICVVSAEGTLWLNGIKIYGAPKLAMRLVES